MSFENLKILIAGGAGFIGSNLLEILLKNNAKVWVLDNLSTGSLSNIENFLSNSKFKFFKCDITEKLPKLPLFDFIINLAAMANTSDYEKNPLVSLNVNAIGNKNLLELAKISSAKYIFFSSSEVYGHQILQLEEAIPENSMSKLFLRKPRSSYFVGKIFGEELVYHYCKENSLENLIIRPFNIYGPKMDVKTNYGRVIPNFIKWGLTSKPLIVNGDGSQERSFCNIYDFISAISLILQKDSFRYNIINIGNPKPISIFELAKLVNLLTDNKAGIKFSEKYEFEPKYRTPNIDRISSWISWKPQICLEEGIINLIDYYNKEKSLRHSFSKSSKFKEPNTMEIKV